MAAAQCSRDGDNRRWQSEVGNALTVILGTDQLIRRAGESGRPLDLERRMDRIEAAARRIAHVLREVSADAHPPVDEQMT